MSKTSVTHVCVGLNVGGMEKLLVEFARHTDRARFDLNFVSLTGGGHAAERIQQLGWPVTKLNVSPGLKPAISFQLGQLFRQNSASVIHTHNTKPLLYAVPAGRLAGVGTIIHTSHGERHGQTRRQSYLFDLMAAGVDRLVSVSNDGTKFSLAEGVPQQKRLTIQNGIDVSQFAATVPRESGPVVFVGRLSPEKDIPTLLRATAVAISEEPSFRLHLAGAGPSLMELQRLAEELGVAKHVVFLGHTNDVGQILTGASLFVLPSLTEGISLALLEAMACGLPAVATAVGGNSEVVVDGETGLLVPSQSPSELAAAMLKLYRQPELATRMGAAGRKRVEIHFDSRTMVALYESLYVSARSTKAAA